MAINKFTSAVLRALSYPDLDIQHNYKLDRVINELAHPTLKLLYLSEDLSVPSAAGEIPVRLFYPDVQTDDECVLFFHGGGWVSGSTDTYTRVCSTFATAAGRRVISVDYRLAPENRFPAAFEDCYAVARELAAACRRQKGVKTAFDLLRPSRFALMGDSAGGNLCAAVSLAARDRGEFTVARQILLYPAVYNDHTETSPFASIRENGADYMLTSKKICDYMALYTRGEEDYANPYFAPLLAESFAGLPETLVITAEFDPLRDEGEYYGRRLEEAGVPVKVCRMKDALHGFISLPSGFVHVKKYQLAVRQFLDREEVTAVDGDEEDEEDDRDENAPSGAAPTRR